MKTLLATTALSVLTLTSSLAFAELNCDVLTTQDEDIIRIAEYPTVSFTDREAHLGAALYTVKDGSDIIEHVRGTRRAIWVIANAKALTTSERFELLMDTTTGAATLSYLETPSAAPIEFATLLCR